METRKERQRPHARPRPAFLVVVLLLLPLAALPRLSCQGEGNATPGEREALARAVREYWETGRDYNLGFTSGVGDPYYANIAGDEAEVRTEIIVGYSQPTEGAGYRDATFRLRRENGAWKVTYDGWANKEVR